MRANAKFGPWARMMPLAWPGDWRPAEGGGGAGAAKMTADTGGPEYSHTAALASVVGSHTWPNTLAD